MTLVSTHRLKQLSVSPSVLIQRSHRHARHLRCKIVKTRVIRAERSEPAETRGHVDALRADVVVERFWSGGVGGVIVAVRRIRAFTLVELLIILAFLAILAAIVVPQYTHATDVSRAVSMAHNVQMVRGEIAMKSATAGVDLSNNGYPLVIDSDWFPRHMLPDHAWSGRPMIIESIAGLVGDVFPASKVFDSTNVAAANAWYNTTNGAFCVRVPPQTTDAATLEMFNAANSTSAIGINVTQ